MCPQIRKSNAAPVQSRTVRLDPSPLNHPCRDRTPTPPLAQSGSVADKLHVVDQSIRSRLDELKRIELERLRRKATEAYELSNGLDRDAIKEPLHLEHRNPHTFREEDLRRLVRKVGAAPDSRYAGDIGRAVAVRGVGESSGRFICIKYCFVIVCGYSISFLLSPN